MLIEPLYLPHCSYRPWSLQHRGMPRGVVQTQPPVHSRRPVLPGLPPTAHCPHTATTSWVHDGRRRPSQRRGEMGAWFLHLLPMFWRRGTLFCCVLPATCLHQHCLSTWAMLPDLPPDDGRRPGPAQHQVRRGWSGAPWWGEVEASQLRAMWKGLLRSGRSSTLFSPVRRPPVHWPCLRPRRLLPNLPWWDSYKFTMSWLNRLQGKSDWCGSTVCLL